MGLNLGTFWTQGYCGKLCKVTQFIAVSITEEEMTYENTKTEVWTNLLCKVHAVGMFLLMQAVFSSLLHGLPTACNNCKKQSQCLLHNFNALQCIFTWPPRLMSTICSGLSYSFSFSYTNAIFWQKYDRREAPKMNFHSWMMQQSVEISWCGLMMNVTSYGKRCFFNSVKYHNSSVNTN